MKVPITALALISLPFAALAQEQPTEGTPQPMEPAVEEALAPENTTGDADAAAPADVAAALSLAGVNVDPALVEQILAEAGPNPSPEAIAAVGNRLAAAASDPAPVLAAALTAGKQAGVSTPGLVSIAQSMVTSHAATSTATNGSVSTMAAVTHAALPAESAGRAVAQVIAAAVATNPRLSRGDITSTTAATIANTQSTGESVGSTGSTGATGGEGSPRTSSPVVTAANMPSGASGGGGGNNQPFIAPSASPTPAPPYGG